MIKMKKLFALATAVALVASMMAAMTIAAFATGDNLLVEIDLWNANLDQPSMGNIATDYNPKGLYNPTTGTLQIALNPVSVSGYQSGLGGMRYDTTGKGSYVSATTLSTTTVNIGTKYDGIDRQITVLTCVEIQLPSYLTQQGVEYIPLEMQVPYTPMDSVIGDGYLSSRLRIDWSSATATDLTALQPNTTMSAGEVAPLVLENQGFLVNTDTNTLSEVTRLSVEKVTSGSDYTLASTALAGESFELYRINLTVGSADTTPTGSIFITFPYDNLDSLYRINATGTKTALYGTQEKAGYEIMTRSIGLFAVVGGEKQVTATPVTPQIEAAQTPNQEEELSQETSPEISLDDMQENSLETDTETDTETDIEIDTELPTGVTQNQNSVAVYANSSYWNPDTGEIDDGGTANAALGDGMSRSVTGTTALVEWEGDVCYVTLRLLLQSSTYDAQFWTRTDYNSYEALSYEIVAENTQTDSVDYRFAVADPYQPIRASMYVIPMGRDTVWYIQLDETTASGDTEEFFANSLAEGDLQGEILVENLAQQEGELPQEDDSAEVEQDSVYLQAEFGAIGVVLVTAIAIALGVMWVRGKKA